MAPQILSKKSPLNFLHACLVPTTPFAQSTKNTPNPLTNPQPNSETPIHTAFQPSTHKNPTNPIVKNSLQTQRVQLNWLPDETKAQGNATLWALWAPMDRRVGAAEAAAKVASPVHVPAAAIAMIPHNLTERDRISVSWWCSVERQWRWRETLTAMASAALALESGLGPDKPLPRSSWPFLAPLQLAISRPVASGRISFIFPSLLAFPELRGRSLVVRMCSCSRSIALARYKFLRHQTVSFYCYQL